MNEKYYINFCLRQHPDFGGTYTAQNLFKKVLNCYFIDLQIPGFPKNSEADYTIYSGINPFTGYLKSLGSEVLSFIPSSVRINAAGIIAHGLFLSHFSYAYNCSQKLELPLYIIPHGASDPYVFSYNKIKKKLWLNTIGKLSASSCKKIIFSSELEKKKSVFSQSVEKGVVCPYAVDIPQNIDKLKLNSRQFILHKFNLSEDDKILLYFGKLDPFKRPLETIESFIRVKPKNWKLLVVGHYDNLSYRDKIYSFSSHPEIIVHPPVFGMEKWMFLAGSDLFVLFSHRENFGFSVTEAASVATPVMISQGVDIYPFFKNATKDLLFSISDSQDIDEALSSLNHYDQNYLKFLGLVHQNIVKENFSFTAFSDCLSKILDFS
ncbi:MAG: glycosyltransferase [Cylindrospermopsis raciborskii KL1]|uniref:glycosyltransferase n=1 Tax=Cylindrospermopsis raciborskii TaxID=77022 RepID=UPI001A30038A|nr:glycosyltransferase [Cylindrospermopsis raciborskii]MBG0744719.1 glycosyltransferase [Cylindrospermopsis raciborskii KL1]